MIDTILAIQNRAVAQLGRYLPRGVQLLTREDGEKLSSGELMRRLKLVEDAIRTAVVTRDVERNRWRHAKRKTGE